MGCVKKNLAAQAQTKKPLLTGLNNFILFDKKRFTEPFLFLI
jgi:hypothetical protein